MCRFSWVLHSIPSIHSARPSPLSARGLDRIDRPYDHYIEFNDLVKRIFIDVLFTQHQVVIDSLNQWPNFTAVRLLLRRSTSFMAH